LDSRSLDFPQSGQIGSKQASLLYFGVPAFGKYYCQEFQSGATVENVWECFWRRWRSQPLDWTVNRYQPDVPGVFKQTGGPRQLRA
jgi:hypothetical protein